VSARNYKYLPTNLTPFAAISMFTLISPLIGLCMAHSRKE
jgi:hypothetical protein